MIIVGDIFIENILNLHLQTQYSGCGFPKHRFRICYP